MTIFAEIDLLLYPRCARIQLDLAKARQMTSSARSARRGGDIVEWLILKVLCSPHLMRP